MGQNRVYEIAFVGLQPGEHEFEYRIEDKFFTDFGPQDFSNCQTTVKLRLEKNVGFMQLRFDVDGTVDSQCDRCGNPLTIQLWDEFNLIVKLVDDPDAMNSNEEDPDIYYIDRNESHLSVATWIYEFINLSNPLQKICKENENGESTCNQKVLDQLKKFQSNPNEIPNKNIWKGLDQFKNFDEES
ncbi:MAG: DUF177 domain-containing protein [Chitinophagaceae bacterium]